MEKFSVKKILLKTMMASSQNDAHNNKASQGQMIPEKNGKTEVNIYHIPSVCSLVSDETSQTHVCRVSRHVSGLSICYVEEWDFSEAGM